MRYEIAVRDHAGLRVSAGAAPRHRMPRRLLLAGLLFVPRLAFAWPDICNDFFGRVRAQGPYANYYECMGACNATSVTLNDYSCPVFCPEYCSGTNPPPRYSADQKRRFQAQADEYYRRQKVIQAYSSLICLSAGKFSGLCSAVLAAIAGTDGMLGDLYAKKAKDPADPNYLALVVPATPGFAAITATDAAGQTAANAVNALLQNRMRQIGLHRAILASIDRATGAVAAGDAAAENLQMVAASEYSLEVAALENQQAALETAVIAALTDAGFPVPDIAPADVQRMQQDVADHGLPDDVMTVLRTAGADQATIDDITAAVEAPEDNAYAGSLADLISTTLLPDTVAAEAELASSNGVATLAPGHSIYGSGPFKAASGDRVSTRISVKVSRFTKTLGGTLNLNDSGASPAVAIGGAQVLNAATQGANAIVDGTYTDASGAAGTFVLVATPPNDGTSVNHITAGLSTGYAAYGNMIFGHVTVR